MNELRDRNLKKVVAWGVLLVLGCGMLFGVVTIVQSTPVQAVVFNGAEQGDKDSMYKKLSYGALEACLKDVSTLNSTSEWYDLGAHFGLKDFEYRASSLRNGDWFPGNPAGTEQSRKVGGLLEHIVSGNVHGDDKIYCGENNNVLMKKFISNDRYLNLQDSYEQVFCDGNDFKIFRKGTHADSCTRTFNETDGKFFANALLDSLTTDVSRDIKKEDYLDALVKKTAFSGKVPGGSLYEMTDLEQYFLLYDTFTGVCSSGEATDDSSLTYAILVRDPNSGKLVKKYFSEMESLKKNESFILRMKGSSPIKTTCAKIAKTLGDENSLEVKAYKEYMKIVPVDEEQDSPEVAENSKICKENSGSLGWVICPVIQAGAEIGSYMYGRIEEEFLQLKVNEMFEGGGELETVWNSFRDIANVIFIVFFLVVIFSQLTGVGIDNYGIKKALPKMIVVAILINLSFLICALAADLSNILGMGLNEMFTSMAQGIKVNTVEPTVSGSIAAAGLAGGGAVLFTLLLNPVGVLSFASIAVAVGMAVLGIVVSVGVSIFFMYLALMVRNVGVVLLIAVSPVAIVCYMLPNMDKTAKKWYELFKALLLLYPICGALIGAGKLAGRLLASFDNTSMVIAGMVAEVVPFFMIPKVLKASLQMMGNIGARLMDTGRHLGKRGAVASKKGITGTKRFQDWQKAEAYKNARKVRDRLGKRKNLTEAQMNRYSRAQHEAAVYESGREKMFKESFARNDRGDNMEAFRSALTGSDAQRATAGLSTLISQGGISEALDVLSDENLDWDKMDAGVRDEVVMAMGASGIDVMKGFSKYKAAGGAASFRDWSNGTISEEQSAKDASNGRIKADTASYAKYLRANGPSAMNKYSKDEMAYVESIEKQARGSGVGGLRQGMGNSAFGAMIGNAAVYSGDARAQTVAENIIQSELADGRMEMKDLKFTSQMFGDMREETARAIWAGESQHIQAKPGMSADRVEAETNEGIRNAFGSQIAGIESDNRILNKMKPGVQEVLGMRTVGGTDTGGASSSGDEAGFASFESGTSSGGSSTSSGTSSAGASAGPAPAIPSSPVVAGGTSSTSSTSGGDERVTYSRDGEMVVNHERNRMTTTSGSSRLDSGSEAEARARAVRIQPFHSRNMGTDGANGNRLSGDGGVRPSRIKGASINQNGSPGTSGTGPSTTE